MAAMSEGDAGAGSGVIALWRGAGRVLAPATSAYLTRRASRGKEDPERVDERHGVAGEARPAGALAWVHAASVGESQSVVSLLERLIAAGITPLITTGTVTAARVVEAHAPAGTIHQFAPLDFDTYVNAFLDHWKPSFALFVESEIWPVTLDLLAGRGIPSAVVNGRMSEKSFRGWQRAGRLARPVFQRLGMVLAQSEQDAIRYRRLGVLEVTNTGNLKLAAEPLPCVEEDLAALRQAIGDRPLWLAASTHPGEEKIVAGVHQALTGSFEGLLTIIVPRHPERGPSIVRSVGSGGLADAVALRSVSRLPTARTRVFVADTLGEMGLFYRLARVVFVGGSLVKVGGHNPMEPVRLGAAIIAGPHTDNFDPIYQQLFDANAVRMVESQASLAAAVRRLLADASQIDTQVERGTKVLGTLGKALDRTWEHLSGMVEEAQERERRAPTPATPLPVAVRREGASWAVQASSDEVAGAGPRASASASAHDTGAAAPGATGALSLAGAAQHAPTTADGRSRRGAGAESKAQPAKVTAGVGGIAAADSGGPDTPVGPDEEAEDLASAAAAALDAIHDLAEAPPSPGDQGASKDIGPSPPPEAGHTDTIDDAGVGAEDGTGRAAVRGTAVPVGLRRLSKRLKPGRRPTDSTAGSTASPRDAAPGEDASGAGAFARAAEVTGDAAPTPPEPGALPAQTGAGAEELPVRAALDMSRPPPVPAPPAARWAAAVTSQAVTASDAFAALETAAGSRPDVSPVTDAPPDAISTSDSARASEKTFPSGETLPHPTGGHDAAVPRPDGIGSGSLARRLRKGPAAPPTPEPPVSAAPTPASPAAGGPGGSSGGASPTTHGRDGAVDPHAGSAAPPLAVPRQAGADAPPVATANESWPGSQTGKGVPVGEGSKRTKPLRLDALRRFVRDLKQQPVSVRPAEPGARNGSGGPSAAAGGVASNAEAVAAGRNDGPQVGSGRSGDLSPRPGAVPGPETDAGGGPGQTLPRKGPLQPAGVRPVDIRPGADSAAEDREEECLAIREAAAARRGRKYLRAARNVAAARQEKRRAKARQRRAAERGVWSSRRRYLRRAQRGVRPHA